MKREVEGKEEEEVGEKEVLSVEGGGVGQEVDEKRTRVSYICKAGVNIIRVFSL